MDMIVEFPGGSRVDAHFRLHIVRTDQPVQAGGDASAPTPFEIFLSSLGTCAGIYVLGFCRQRNLPTEGLRLVQKAQINQTTGLAEKITIDIQLPPDFPEQYHKAVIRAADQCKVKKHFEAPPKVEVITSNARSPAGFK